MQIYILEQDWVRSSFMMSQVDTGAERECVLCECIH